MYFLLTCDPIELDFGDQIHLKSKEQKHISNSNNAWIVSTDSTDQSSDDSEQDKQIIIHRMNLIKRLCTIYFYLTYFDKQQWP
jgi:hypothetical protein